jgi:glycosyltransferase involved in cell wall biosynthesis
MNKPLISVIIPAYNCEKTIEIAIRSILDQTYSNIEIIVVDDASTDNTWSVAEKLAKTYPNIKLVKGENDPNRFDAKLNRNVNAGWSARNTGFKYAKGELVTFQDADDASLQNRIEVQYELLSKHNSTHTCIDWVQFDEKYLGKKLSRAVYVGKVEMIGPKELYNLSQKAKGIVAKLSQNLNASIPFHIKRMRIIHKIFFGSLENYPGPGNSPLFKREVLEKVKFRPLKERTWPSFMGRGADRDFNFQVAETFGNSHVFFVPLYLWRVPNQNPRYENGIDEVII